jgi:hypothetical protein
MVQQPNWRTINAPQANPASALGVAGGLFQGGGRGFETFASQMKTKVDEADERRLNEHIQAALAGKPLAPDSRVDPTAIQEAVQSQEKFKSDELSASMTRTIQGITGAKGAKELSVFDVNQTAKLEGLRAGTDADIATTERNRAQVAAIQGTEKRRQASETRMKTVEQRWAQLASDNEAGQVAKKEEALGLLRENNPGITDAEVNDAWENVIRPSIQANAQADREAQALSFEAETISELGLSRAEWEATSPGSMITGYKDLAAEQTAKRRSEATEQAEYEREAAGQAAKGKLENLIPSGDGFRVVRDKDEASRNKLKISANSAKNQISSRHRVELSASDEGRALDVLQIVGGNKAVFDEVIRAGITTNWEFIGSNFPEITSNGWKKIFTAANTAANGLRAAGTQLQKEQSKSTSGAQSVEQLIGALTETRKDEQWKASPEGQAALANKKAEADAARVANATFDYDALYNR